MKHIPREELLAFARECLKLEQLLSEDDLSELSKFIKLVRSMEESGGLSALKALLRPEGTDWLASPPHGIQPYPPPAKGTVTAPLKDGPHSLCAPLGVRPSRRGETSGTMG